MELDNKCEILWISACVPIKNGREAGTKTFFYYYDSIRRDKRFNVKLIAFCKEYLRSEGIEDNKGYSTDFIYYDSFSIRKKIINIESKINPYHKYGGLMTNLGAIEVKKRLKSLKKEGYYPDVIILEWTQIVIMAPMIKQIFPDAVLVASEHDVTFIGYGRKYQFYHGLKKIYWKIKYQNEKKKELSAVQCCDIVLPQNPDNIKLLEEEGIQGSKLNWLIPYFENLSHIKRQKTNTDVLFYGAMGRKENYLSAVWFIEKVMPLLKDDGIRFVVLGSNPPQVLKELESDNICVTGFVKNIRPYFEKSLCLVAPLVLGAGIKVKILEALSSGLPVLTNSVGIEGIPAHDNIDYIHCENPQDYVNAVKRALRKELFDVGEMGKLFIKDTYNLEQSANNYKNILLKTVEERKRE